MKAWETEQTPTTVLFLVAEDWYFVSHRLPMARAARSAGYEVHVATHVAAHADAIRAEGFVLHELPWRRGTLNPASVGRMAWRVRELYLKLRPTIVHHVALQPALIGSIASEGLGLRVINAVTGLGFAFSSTRTPARLIRRPVAMAMRVLFNRPRVTVLVQNDDDRDLVSRLGVHSDRIALIPGSGVDTEHYQQMPEPSGELTVAYVGRFLRAKGVETIVDAHRLLVDRGRQVTLILAGERDPMSRDSIPRSTIDEWRRLPRVEILGHVDDVRTVWRRAHVALLASQREGLPMSMLEAASCGRPMVSTDVPGSREIASQGRTALLVPVGDSEAMAAAITRLADDGPLRRRLGDASRRLAAGRFSREQVGAATLDLYHRVLAT